MNNAWRLDLWKLVIPNIFFNVDLIKKVGKSYNQDTKSVYTQKGVLVARFDRGSICEMFMLNPNVDMPIDFLSLGREYE